MTAEDIDLFLGARHVLSQGKVLAALMGVAGRSLWPGRRGKSNGQGTPAAGLTLPGPEVTAAVTAPLPALVRDYARAVGAAPGSYCHPATVPAHLFPQWTFPVAARGLSGLPYPLARLLNAGCRLEVNAPIPAGAPLQVTAQLMDVQANDRRALLHQRVVTNTPGAPRALVVDLYAVAPLAPRRAERGPTGATPGRTAARTPMQESDGPALREVVTVPHGARELARLHLGPRAGLAYAFLTGDFNPVHWVAAYARASGFPGPIMHGFALLGRTVEALGRALFAGATERIRLIDVKFKRALVLGSGVTVGLYLGGRNGDEIYLADAPGVRPYLTGTFATRETHA